MQHEIILYLTLPEVTKFMRRLDLCHPDKYFTVPYVMTAETDRNVNDEYLNKMVALLGKIDQEKPFVAALSYMQNMYFAPGVKIVSDGKHEMWNDND